MDSTRRRGRQRNVSDRQKRDMEEQLERDRWWSKPQGTISASLVVRGDKAPPAVRGAWAKWNRAVEHYNDLKQTASEWLSTAWTIECSFDAELGEHVATFRVLHDDILERLRVGAIAGDCFHNLRSALDYVMWELVHQCAHTRGNPVITDPKKLARLPPFPLAFDGETRDAFARRVRKAPVTERVMNRIVEVHDFGENGAMPYLRYLRVLSNNDKHRSALAATVAVDLRSTRFVVHPPELEPDIEFLWEAGEGWEDGTRVAIVRVEEGAAPDRSVVLQERPPSQVQLKYMDGSTTAIDIWTMAGVLLVVQDVLDRLQELFDDPTESVPAGED
jgi:hypothetical protein